MQSLIFNQLIHIWYHKKTLLCSAGINFHDKSVQHIVLILLVRRLISLKCINLILLRYFLHKHHPL